MDRELFYHGYSGVVSREFLNAASRRKIMITGWKNSAECMQRQMLSHHAPTNMSRSADSGMPLGAPPALHVGPILNPGTNETISIVIPLSTQLASVSTQVPEKSCKDCGKDVNSVSSKCAMNRTRADKTKGCPFPTCVRYGRAFSRAHDLKRHIARHEMRKEKLSDMEKGQFAGAVAGHHLVSEAIAHKDRPYNLAGRDDARDSVIKTYSCMSCKKKYISENKLRAHMSTHEKIHANNVCALCNTQFQNEGDLQEHMKHHTAHILHAQGTSEKSHVPYQKDTDKDDDFLLEEMLLLNKNSKRSALGKSNINGASKIRCDYCSKTFKTKWTLSSHVAAHEGRFQFDCGQCGKKFVRKSHYEGHVRSHEAARPYTCEQCGKTFKELKHRREHTKRKHPTNQNAIQSLLDSINPCTAEEIPDQAKFTLLMPMNFSA